MDVIKEIARLSERGQSKAEIENITGVTRKTIRGYLDKLAKANLKFADLEKLSSREIQKLLFRNDKSNQKKTQPNWDYIYQEYQKKSVTLQLLWYEFIDAHPDGISYTRFTKYFNEFKKTLNPSMRQIHNYGEKCFLDFAGHTIPVNDSKTGEVKNAQIFVACLGASNYTFAFAVENQSLENWIYCNKKALDFFGGVPEVLVPDNLKSAVNKACRYEPSINKSYLDYAKHYDVAVMPARVRKPQDKAKVEVAVQIVERWILAALRKETFFSINELNQSIAKLLEQLNSKEFKKLDGNRKYIFEKFEKEKLKPLPEDSFELQLWKKAKVAPDYHVEVEKHFYSVPYKYISKKVDIGFSIHTVNIFYENQLIAKHLRSYDKHKYSTVDEHMPKGHQEHSSWSPEKIRDWALKISENTAKLIEQILAKGKYPAINYRPCIGIIRLEKQYGKERVDKAALRLLKYGFRNSGYQSMKSILKRGLENEPLEDFSEEKVKLEFHENIRGAEYYQEEKEKFSANQ
ncbi:MAG: IS21 family transposase [Candidatus Caenarcaniphilales bacterium]|nr:IS21 family transposase [Candidatus Caenarcaniphilales bacterium]